MKSNPAASKTMHCVRYPLDALDRAKEFLEAFRQLPQQPQLRWISWPRYFLLCHAVEMGLKAFLASRGVSIEKLEEKPFGHHLDRLMNRAARKGLNIGTAATELIKLSDAHTNHWARYPHDIGKAVFAIETFEPRVEELLEAVSQAIWRVHAADPARLGPSLLVAKLGDPTRRRSTKMSGAANCSLFTGSACQLLAAGLSERTV